jgi:voltage-gated potassium channel
MVGDLDDPTTYINARVTEAAMVVASRNDRTNTNIAFTVREIAPEVLIIATANDPAAVDILEIAGADHVVQLGEILGSAMAARTLGPDGRSHVIGEFAGLMIAEASVSGTSLVGHTLAEAQLRAEVGVGIIGVWDRGRFTVATGDTVLGQSTVLLLAGTQPQLDAYDAAYSSQSPEVHHMVIIGGGRVGRAAGQAFAAEGLSYTIVERMAEREHEGVSYVIGDAADRKVLEAAGIDRAGAILITTHDDDVNVYLTRYCRGLRPDVRIVSRAKLDRNVSTLYRAGADAVLSYAGSCSAAIWNHFRGEETLLVAQGLNLFRTRIPKELAGKSLAESHLYRRTRCNVVAVVDDQGIHGNPDAHQPLPAGGELVVIGTEEAEASFCEDIPECAFKGALRQWCRPDCAVMSTLSTFPQHTPTSVEVTTARSAPASATWSDGRSGPPVPYRVRSDSTVPLSKPRGSPGRLVKPWWSPVPTGRAWWQSGSGTRRPSTRICCDEQLLLSCGQHQLGHIWPRTSWRSRLIMAWMWPLRPKRPLRVCCSPPIAMWA